MKASRLPTSQVPGDEVGRLLGDYFFASPGFASVWRAKGGRPVAWVAEDAGAVAAILPGVEFGRGPLCRFLSMPDGCYGGAFFAAGAAAASADRDRIARLLLEAIVRRRYAKTFLYDFYGTLAEAPRFRLLPCATRLVDIAGEAWSPPDAKLVSQIRKAEREGIRVEPFAWDRHGGEFLRLVRASERQHGRAPRYPPAFYAALARLARDDDRVRWQWCAREGRAAASHIYFVEHGALQAWQTYFDRSFSFLKPNQFIRFELCRSMARQGIARLNLGATPPGAAGLERYKSRWGGRPFHYNGYVRREGLGRLL